MSILLYMFLAEGVASEPSGYRQGARHSLMLFATGESLEMARGQAVSRAVERGWAHIVVIREKSLGADAGGVDDEVLREAAETALSEGASIVVYAEEIPLNG